MVEQDMLTDRPTANRIKNQASEFIVKKLHSLYGLKEELKSLESKLSAIQATVKNSEGSFSRTNSEQQKDWLMKFPQNVQATIISGFPTVSSNQEERRAQGIHLLLEYQGFKTSALDSIAVALSPLAVKSLSDEEKGDALVKRAELKVEVSLLEKSGGGGLLDQAVEEDLVEAVKLRPDNSRAWCLLGDCYEAKEMMEKAKEAYEAALKAQPDYKPATEALVRLGS